jgi:hypothetical protein
MKLNSNGSHIPSLMTKNNILDTDRNQAKIIRRFSNLINADSDCKEIEVAFSVNYFGSEIAFKLSYKNYVGSTNSVNEDKVGPVYGFLNKFSLSWRDLKLYEKSGETDQETFHFSNFAIMIQRFMKSVDFDEMEFDEDVDYKYPGFIVFITDEYIDNPLYGDRLSELDSIINELINAGKQEFNFGNDLLSYLESSQGNLYRRSIRQNTFELLINILKEYINVLLSNIFNVKIIKQTAILDDDKDVVQSTNDALLEYFKLGFKIDAQLDKNGNYFGNTTHVQNNGREMQMDDMGDGIKSILPLLNKISAERWDDFIEGNSNRKNKKTFFISEPENALHPNWQKKFIEFLINDRYDRYVVETHSLIIVRSLQLAVAEGQISPEDVAIYDFYEEKDGTKSMQPIRILPDGQLDGKFMNGFDDLVNDMELELWRIAQSKLSIN